MAKVYPFRPFKPFTVIADTAYDLSTFTTTFWWKAQFFAACV